ncbi:hypothetical protein Q5P01_000836 [Channa striata]|uniref:Uncharacterized protein n=1 Tax=Channa striata TaxID=64152 RepID=A0AA88IH36_CHASR|nr:hypothetical protein Q5P01_000836 [Channa striata]
MFMSPEVPAHRYVLRTVHAEATAREARILSWYLHLKLCDTTWQHGQQHFGVHEAHFVYQDEVRALSSAGLRGSQGKESGRD